ncbi:diaminopimelate decarboxylase [Frankia tisae]|uniref:diaminopimelate decarboxylase n=1 Tax=Frankia tisae TaxID=2950104 RepID=UPI0021C1DDBD|nr:diaminopimelate decarboxylase [Frankia tisae]
MPMSTSFAQRLLPHVHSIAQEFGTPFHVYDELGIVESGQEFNAAFSGIDGFREFYAVKALPNLRILEILRNELGFGFDCSSTTELTMARRLGASGKDIMFTSNNTSPDEYEQSLDHGGCILNLDDLTFVRKLPRMPELICFRYNPGTSNFGNSIIGAPRSAKFGLRHDQMIAAYTEARARGAQRFGLHAMVVSNERRHRRMAAILQMLLEVCGEITAATDIRFEFVNVGGGIAIPYRPGERPFELQAFADLAIQLLDAFEREHGYRPKMYMECGRLITGPHGVLVTRVLNVMSKYRSYVGVDASMSDLMRPGMYKSAYNHITVVDRAGQELRGPLGAVDVVGSLCENLDKFATDILLPPVKENDYVVMHDTGAHGHSMGFQYNGRLRPQELLLRRDGSVELIRRSETVDDYLRTQLDFESRRFTPAGGSQRSRSIVAAPTESTTSGSNSRSS